MNLLIHDALKACGDEFSTWIAETEFWSPMRDPNLLMEVGDEDVSEMLTALSFHVGEVERNPYHVRTAMWMVDNVRRGGEIVGGQGAAPPTFTFGINYRISRWRNGQKESVKLEKPFWSSQDNLLDLFQE